MKYSNKDIIFLQGEKADCAYVIESGQVEIFYYDDNSSEIFLSLLGDGELFGEMALIDIGLRTACARARGDVVLQTVRREQILEKINSSDTLVQFLIKILVQRLKRTNIKYLDTQAGLHPNMNHDQEAVNSLKYENEIYQAFKNNEFMLFHQPILDLKNKKILGSEALVRWKKENGHWASPSEFIEIVENSSISIPFGYWVFEECFKHYKEMSAINPNLSISINVSGRQFMHLDFLKNLDELIKKYDVPTSQFKIEIIERVLMDRADLIQVLLLLRQRGFQISLDDFGTGYSSLQYLAQLPIDYLKIDRSFVINLFKDHKTLSVVRSIIYMAQQLGLKVITEGIETEEEFVFVRELGSDYGQGYFFSRPIPFADYLELIQKNDQIIL